MRFDIPMLALAFFFSFSFLQDLFLSFFVRLFYVFICGTVCIAAALAGKCTFRQ
jgi:hypothetical protein